MDEVKVNISVGNYTSKNPNVQQIPKQEEMEPIKEYIFIVADFSSVGGFETRISHIEN